MMEKRNLTVEFDFENTEYCNIYDTEKSNEIILSEQAVENVNKMFDHKLCEINSIILNNKNDITSIFNENYDFFIDLKNECFYINVSLSAKESAVLVERILMMYPDYVFKDVIYKEWDSIKIGEDAENGFYSQLAITEAFSSESIQFSNEGNC